MAAICVQQVQHDLEAGKNLKRFGAKRQKTKTQAFTSLREYAVILTIFI
jgi:hypothetical protein